MAAKVKNNKVYFTEDITIYENSNVKVLTNVPDSIAQNDMIGDVLVTAGDTIITQTGVHLLKNQDGSYTNISAGGGASEPSVNASYYVSMSGYNKTSDPATPIDFETKLYDTNDDVTVGSAWKFTASVAGVYSVYTVCNINGNNTLSIFKNGVAYCNLVGVNNGQQANAVASLALDVGDYIDLRLAGANEYFGGSAGGYTTIISINKDGPFPTP